MVSWHTDAAGAVVVQTPRLLLRRWTADDQAAFAAINADPVVAEFLPSTLDRAQSDAMMQRLQATIDAVGYGYWAAQLRSSGALIGFVGLKPCPEDMPFLPALRRQLAGDAGLQAAPAQSQSPEPVIGELGWRLAPQYWRQGLATEGALAAALYGVSAQQMAALVAFTAVQNQRSLAVMQRLHMRDAGVFDHPALGADSPLRAHRWMLLTAPEVRLQAATRAPL